MLAPTGVAVVEVDLVAAIQHNTLEVRAQWGHSRGDRSITCGPARSCAPSVASTGSCAVSCAVRSCHLEGIGQCYRNRAVPVNRVSANLRRHRSIWTGRSKKIARAIQSRGKEEKVR